MLRIEKIFKKDEIQEEIDAYNPLIPDGTNLKATMLIMYPDVEVRRQMLLKLHDIENNIWISVGQKKVIAFADEDLDRSTDENIRSTLLRFQLTHDEVTEFLSSDKIVIGVDHKEYNKEVTLIRPLKKVLKKILSLVNFYLFLTLISTSVFSICRFLGNSEKSENTT